MFNNFILLWTKYFGLLCLSFQVPQHNLKGKPIPLSLPAMTPGIAQIWQRPKVDEDMDIWAEGSEARLRSKAAKQPRYLNAYIGQVLGGCPRVHHTPCTSARRCLFPSFCDYPMTEVKMVFYGSCPDSSPVLRTMTWLKPWKSKNGTFTALDLLNGWDLGHDP